MTAPLPPLLALLQLAERARQSATPEELRFVLVNETHTLAPYRQAVLLDAKGKVLAISGIPLIDPQTPFVLWVQRLFASLENPPGQEPMPLSIQTAREALREEWAEWLPPEMVILPLATGGERLGWLLLARDEPFDDEEIQLLGHLMTIHAHAWSCHLKKTPASWWRPLRAGRVRVAVWVVLLALLFLWRIPLSALAPGEIVAIDPEVVRAPMDGVVDRFHVLPNARVTPGQALFDLDDTVLVSRLHIARKNLAIAESEYQIASQQALLDARSKGRLAILRGRIEEKRLEAQGLEALLSQSRVTANRSGIALFSDPMGWIGRPVITGERILTVASEEEVEIEAWLAAGDLVPLAPAAETTLFLNIDPLHPQSGKLRFLAYEAVLRPDGSLAYQVRATLTGGATRPRLGLKGMARIEGQEVPLLWWLLRRPLAEARQWLGW